MFRELFIFCQYNDADMANNILETHEQTRIIRDIKEIIERDTGASSETETKNLNTTNDSMERLNDSDANTATTNEEEQTGMEIEKREAEREKKNDDGMQYNTNYDKTKERNSA